MKKTEKNEFDKEKKQSTITFQAPISLKNSFKSKVAAEGKAIREVLCELMEKYTKAK